MNAIHKALKRRSRPALRLLATSGLAFTLAGCYQTQVAQVEYPVDYRQRHPITVFEGVQNVEVMVGRNRGGLTPSQRADVVAFAQSWRRELSSGIIIDIHAAAQQIAPPQTPYVRSAPFLPPSECRPTRSMCVTIVQRDMRWPASSSTIRGWSRTRDLAAVAEGPWPIHQVRRHRKSAVLESRLRHSTQSCGHG